MDLLSASLLAAFACASLLAAWGAATLVRAARRHRERFGAAVDSRLREAFLSIDTGRLLALNLGLGTALAALAMLLTGRIEAAALAALAAGAAPRVALALLRRRREAAFREQMPDLLMLVAGGLRAGSGLAQAIGQASAEIDAPAKQELALMLREQRMGATLAQALAGLERRMPIEETALFASALRIGSESGGNMADALESLAGATRRRLAIEGKIRALTAQGRLQAWVMGLLPFGLAAVLWLMEPDAMRALFTTAPGLAVCAFVVLAQAAGVALIRRIVAIEV